MLLLYIKPNPLLREMCEFISSSIAEKTIPGDLLIYLKQSVRLMEMITMMALVIMVAFFGIGFTVTAVPLITEVSAQGNATGNQTGNWTDTGSGNISGVLNPP